MFCFNPNPTKSFCTSVAKDLVKKYPFMKDTGLSGYGSWEKKLIEKVHNTKARNPKRALEADSDSSDSTPKSKRGRPKMSSVLTRYPPLKDTVDDEVSMKRHFTQLSKELEKPNPRKDVVLSLAQQTYPSRRAVILSESATITARSLLEQFAELAKSYVIEQEFNLILETPDACEKAELDWKAKWVPAIIQYHPKFSTGKKLSDCYKTADKAYTSDQFRKEKIALSILCKALSKKSVENPLMYMYEDCKLTDDPEGVANAVPIRVAPRIAAFPGEEQTQFFVFVEGTTLCIVNSLSMWFICHYVLNLEYCPQVREVALFVQEFVFNLPATSGTKRQKTSTYLIVTTDIKNLVEE